MYSQNFKRTKKCPHCNGELDFDIKKCECGYKFKMPKYY